MSTSMETRETRSSVVSKSYWLLLLLALLGPIASGTDKRAAALSAQIIVVGKLDDLRGFPWVDGWHTSGTIRVQEVLKGTLTPGTALPYRFVCSCCHFWPRPGTREMFQEMGIWMLNRNKEGMWESAGNCSDPGFKPLSERNEITKLISSLH
jgi:hypothetical protein